MGLYNQTVNPTFDRPIKNNPGAGVNSPVITAAAYANIIVKKPGDLALFSYSTLTAMQKIEPLGCLLYDDHCLFCRKHRYCISSAGCRHSLLQS
jgi:hypothetical protein